jgi:hypothetical protein
MDVWLARKKLVGAQIDMGFLLFFGDGFQFGLRYMGSQQT